MSAEEWRFLDVPRGSWPKVPKLDTLFMGFVETRPYPAYITPMIWRMRADRFECVSIITDREVELTDLRAWRPLTDTEAFYFGTMRGELHNVQGMRLGLASEVNDGN